MTTILFWVPVLALLLASLPAFLACNPSNDTIQGCQFDTLVNSLQSTLVESAYFYEDIIFVGQPLVLSELRSLTTLNGEMSSLKVPKGYEVVLFEQDNLSGPFVVLTGEIPSLFSYLFNDRARSLIYRRSIGETQNLPTIFYGVDFVGHFVPIPYGTTQIIEHLICASIKVPKGMRVIVTYLHGARFKYEQTQVFTIDNSQVPFIGDPIVKLVVEMA
jgi:hypothetical protein